MLERPGTGLNGDNGEARGAAEPHPGMSVAGSRGKVGDGASARGVGMRASGPVRPQPRTARYQIEMPAGPDDPEGERVWKERVHHNFRNRFAMTILRLEAVIVMGSGALVGYAWFSLIYMPEHFNFHWTVYVGQFMFVTTMIMAGLAYFSFRVSERISRHICDATDRLHRLLEGEVPRRLVCFHDDEFHELADTVNDFIARADRNRYRKMFVDPPHGNS